MYVIMTILHLFYSIYFKVERKKKHGELAVRSDNVYLHWTQMEHNK